MIESLTPLQQRVLGSLAEKEATVPDTYPMTAKALTAACNQRNNRDPVTDHDEATVLATLDECKAQGLVRFVYASHGARTTRYRHVLDERLDLDRGELALLTVLLLRGPQTLNELRVRTERAHGFPDNEAVASVLEALAARSEPLVVELARQVGQKETRWVHLLGEDDPDRAAATPEESAVVPSPRTVGADAGLAARVAELEQRVAALEARLADSGDQPGGGESSIAAPSPSTEAAQERAR